MLNDAIVEFRNKYDEIHGFPKKTDSELLDGQTAEEKKDVGLIKFLDEIYPFNFQLDGKVDPNTNNFCLPRYPGCLSKAYIELMNKFGSANGFNMLKNALDPEAMLKEGYKPNFKSDFYMSIMLSVPGPLYHHNFIAFEDTKAEEEEKEGNTSSKEEKLAEKIIRYLKEKLFDKDPKSSTASTTQFGTYS